MGGMADAPYRSDTDIDGRHVVIDDRGRRVLVVETAAAARHMAEALNVGAFESEAKTLYAIRTMGS